MKIELLSETTPIPYSLLLLADPSKELIDDYLQIGECYIGKIEATIIGVLVLVPVKGKTLKIKNIAIETSLQGKGYGKQLLQFAEKNARQQGHQKLLIGTGNSSIGQLALYQKMGFEIDYLKKNFFVENYKEPIVENGIVCKHMVMLMKKL